MTEDQVQEIATILVQVVGPQLWYNRPTNAMCIKKNGKAYKTVFDLANNMITMKKIYPFSRFRIANMALMVALLHITQIGHVQGDTKQICVRPKRLHR